MLFGLSIRPKLHPKMVTFMCEAEPLPQALAQISGSVGVSIQVKGIISNGSAVIHVHNMPVLQFVQKLARTICGEVEKANDGFVIVASPAKLANREKAFEVHFAKQFKETSTDGEAELGDDGTPIPSGTGKSLVTRGPNLNNMLINASLTLGLGRLKPGECVTYSLKPNKGQKQLPISMAKEFHFVDSELTNPAVPSPMRVTGITEIELSRYAVSGDFNSPNSEITYMLALKDQRGKVFTSLLRNLPRWGVIRGNEESKVVISNSEKSTGYIGLKFKYIANGLKSQDHKTFARTFIETKNVVQYDPLLYDGEALLEIAHSEHKNLIAVLPDDFSDVEPFRMNLEHLNLTYATKNLLKDISVHTTTGKQTLSVGPSHPNEQDKQYLNRDFLNDLIKNQYGDLASTIRNWMSIGRHYGVRIPFLYQGYFQYRGPLEATIPRFQIFAFQSRLSLTQERMIGRGESLEYGDLSSAAQKVLREIIYSSNVTFQPGFYFSAYSHQPGLEGLLYDPNSNLIQDNSYSFGSTEDISDYLPNGVPNSTKIVIAWKPNWIFNVVTPSVNLNGVSTGSTMVQVRGTDIVAYLAARASPALAASIPAINSLSMMQVEDGVMSIQVTKNRVAEFGTEISGSNAWKPIAIDPSLLPQSLRHRYELLKAEFAHCKIGTDGHGNKMLIDGKSKFLLPTIIPWILEEGNFAPHP